jgi:hypothetical protein
LLKRNRALFDAAIDYKDEADEYLGSFKARGVEPPMLDLDPDDLLLDEKTQSVRISSRAQNSSRGAQRLLQVYRDQMREECNNLKRLLEQHPGNELIAHDLQNFKCLLSRVEQALDT